MVKAQVSGGLPAIPQEVRAGIYVRESKGDEQSIEGQGGRAELVCRDNGWPIVARYLDDVGASRQAAKKARKDWPRVVADIESGHINLLVLPEVSRADRVMDSWVKFLTLCRERGVRIHVVSDETTYNPRTATHRKALLDAGTTAEHETERLSKRSRDGIESAVRNGKMHGQVPYGLTRIYDQHDRRKFTQQPNEHAPIVKEIIQRIAVREPLLAIERDLNRRGVPSRAGTVGGWRSTHVRDIGLNPSYAGLRLRDGVFHEGNWPGIVDRDTWETARAILEERSRKSDPPARHVWLLSRLVTGRCGQPTQGRKAKGKRTRPWYQCRCGCAAIGALEAETIVVGLIFLRLAEPDVRALFAVDDEAMAKARGLLAAAHAEERDLEAAIDAGTALRPELVARMDAAIQARMAEADRMIAQAASNTAALALLGEGEFLAEDAAPRWAALSIPARRSIIRALVESITLLPSTEVINYRSTDADRLRIAASRIVVRWAESDR